MRRINAALRLADPQRTLAALLLPAAALPDVLPPNAPRYHRVLSRTRAAKAQVRGGDAKGGPGAARLAGRRPPSPTLQATEDGGAELWWEEIERGVRAANEETAAARRSEWGCAGQLCTLSPPVPPPISVLLLSETLIFDLPYAPSSPGPPSLHSSCPSPISVIPIPESLLCPPGPPSLHPAFPLSPSALHSPSPIPPALPHPTPVPAVALGTAAINQAIREGRAAQTLRVLRNPDVGLRGVRDACAVGYQEQLQALAATKRPTGTARGWEPPVLSGEEAQPW